MLHRAIVPEDLVITPAAERRSFLRALSAHALATVQRADAREILRGAWPGDRTADVALQAITRAPVSQTTTADAGALSVEAVKVLPLLAPRSAAFALFAHGLTLPVDSKHPTVRVPHVASVPPAQFIPEGFPAPVVKLTLATFEVGPPKKILILAATTRELQDASPEDATQIIGRVLAASAERGIDSVAFSGAAATDAAPAGLLYGVTPITATAGGGSHAMVSDIAALAAALAANGINPAGMVLVLATKQAITLKLSASPRFDLPIIEASTLPDGTVAAFAPDGIVSAYEGSPSFEIGIDAALHFANTPANIVDGGTPATPTRSLYQEDVVGIRCRARATWAAAPGAVQVINGAVW